MGALTANKRVSTKMVYGDVEGRKIDYEVAGSTTIYKGGFVALDATGYLEMFVPAASQATIVGNRVVGIAMDYVDNSSGSDGDLRCQVLTAGSVEYVLAGAVIADVGAPVFLSDDNTLNKDAGTGPFVGWIENLVSAGNVILAFDFRTIATALIARTSVSIDLTAVNDLVSIIHPTENHNGLIILWAGLYITADTDATSAVLTLQDTAGVTTTLTFTSTVTNGEVAGDIVACVANKQFIGAATGSTLVIIPADKGLDAKVTTASGTGAGNLVILAIPIA